MRIGSKEVGPGNPCFVIAEAGVNHDGDLQLALRLVDAAADADADAVKFQTFRADRVASPDAPKAAYQEALTPAGESQLEMLRRLELGADGFARLQQRAHERGLVFLSTPFDVESVELLDRLGVAGFKIASPDLVNPLLLEDVGRRGRPVILSTGLADLTEVEAAVETLRAAGTHEIVVLHCVSAYPAPVEEANVRAIVTMSTALRLPVGYSDHTEGDEAALAAVALGAVALEKHLTLDPSLPGPDQRASLDPESFAALVRRVRLVELSLGTGVKSPSESERRNAPTVRRSLAAAGDLAAGTTLRREMLTALRPGTGIPATQIAEVVGRRIRRALGEGELIAPDDLE